jgi:hypothetical protein
MAADFDWELFNTEQHREAQRNCWCLIHCAVDGPTRKAVSDLLDYARKVGDGPGILVRIAQLAGPCCLPPADPGTGTDTGTEPNTKEDKPCPPTGENPLT